MDVAVFAPAEALATSGVPVLVELTAGAVAPGLNRVAQGALRNVVAHASAGAVGDAWNVTAGGSS